MADADARVRRLAEHAAVLMLEIDLDGNLLYASPGSGAILGYSRDEVLAIRPVDLVHPEDRAHTLGDYERALRDGIASSVHRARHRDGGWRWMQDTITSFRADDGKLRFVAIGRDVSAQKELEGALERQAEVQRRIAELSHHFLALGHRDIQAAIRGKLAVAGELARADRTTLIVLEPGRPPRSTTFEWTRAGMQGEGPHGIVREAVRSFRWSTRLLSEGSVVRVGSLADLPAEAAAERDDLERRGVQAFLALPVRSGDHVIGYQIFENTAAPREWSDADVTHLQLVGDIFASAIQRSRTELEIEARRNAERRVAALSRRFIALAPDEIDAAIREGMAEAAAFAKADRSCLHTFGRNGISTYEWCAPGIASHPPRETAWAAERLRAGELIKILDPAELPDAAAEERAELLRRGVRSVLGVPVRSGQRTVGLLIFECMSEDQDWSSDDVMLLRMIGELFTTALRRKRSEDALRESRAQLLQAQKLEAVGRLAGGIAHDFNNLLTVILGFSRPLLAELPEGDPIREDVSEIHASAERAAALTRQLLTFSRRQPVSSQPVLLGETVLGMEQLLRRLMGEDVELGFSLEPGLGTVEIDPHQLEQVIMNIAVNARDAMPDGGSLELATARRSLDAEQARRLGLRRGGSYVMLSASDTGCGMDEATRAHIFDPFFTTKEPGKGTGLGLSIVYSVIEQAGGVIRVAGETRGKGTTFEILLPEGSRDDAQRPARAEAGNQRGSECVLVVEDEPAVRRLTRRILEAQGYEVIEAGNGRDALALDDARLARVDALITDVVMPHLGGGELARRLRLLRPDLPIVFMSGYPQERRDGDETELPAGAFVQKPFDESDLLGKLREVLGG